MSDFNNLNEKDKELSHKKLWECATAFGGMNYFLQLVEALRSTEPHPLRAVNCEFRFPNGTVKWNKVIFYDKLLLLLKVRSNQDKTGNLIPDKQDKTYKSVRNLVRTLSPIQFEVKPKKRVDGEGFTLNPFEIIDEDTTRLNPVFDVLFFCNVNQAKKMLTYKPEKRFDA